MKVNLFEQLILWLYYNRQEFTITTGIVYGHKMYKYNGYTFIELDDNTIAVEGENFYYKVTNPDDLLKILRAVR